MTLLVIVAVLWGIICTKKWTEKILPIGLFLLFAFPVVGVLLNGGLYEKTKVFIPFVPLLVLQSARYIQKSVRQKATFRLIVPWILVLLLILSVWQRSSIEKYHTYILLELLCCGVSFWFARKKQKPVIVAVSSIFCLLCIHFYLHPMYNRMLTGEEFAALHDGRIQKQVEEIQEKDQDYIDFRKEIFHINEPLRNNMMQALTNNPVFLQFMGVKYHLLSQNSQDLSVVENEQAVPVWQGI